MAFHEAVFLRCSLECSKFFHHRLHPARLCPPTAITPVYSSGFELAFVRELLREFRERVKRWWQFPLCRAAQPRIQKSASFCSTVDAKQKSLLACLRCIGCSLWTIGLRFRAPWTPVLRRKRYVPKIPRRFQKLNPNLRNTLRSNRLIHHPATQFGLGCQVTQSQRISDDDRSIQKQQGAVGTDRQGLGLFAGAAVIALMPKHFDAEGQTNSLTPAQGARLSDW